MLLLGLVLLLPGLQNFKLDASSEALVIQGDEAFKTYREVGNTFGNSDFLILFSNIVSTYLFFFVIKK